MNNQKFKWILAVSVTLLLTVHSYIDIGLTAVTSSADLALNMPLTINSMQYHIAVSLHSQQDFIVSPLVLPHKKTLPASKKPKEGEMHVWSLEGYNLEGWKRFFMEVFLFEDSKYSHTISLDLSGIKVIDKKMPMTNGVMSIGPSLTDNLFYQLIKNQTKEYFRQDIVSFYTTPGNKDVRMQLGGYEEENAQGYDNGVRFYEKPIETTSDGKDWAIPVSSLLIAKEKNEKWETFHIPHSGFTAKLTLQSQFVILPYSLKEDLETSFQSEEIECEFSANTNQLQCSNISSIDEALTFVSFSLDTEVVLNISLYDLKDEYNGKSKMTTFFLKLSNKSEEFQLGGPLLRGYYVSINLEKQTLLFSPLNRFTPEISTAEIIRFISIFMGLMVGACIAIVVWQQFNMPATRRNRFTRGKDGVRLVAYQRPSEMEDQF